MKFFIPKLITVILTICLISPLLTENFVVQAADSSNTSLYQEVLSNKKPQTLIKKELKTETVPEIIGIDAAKEKRHVARLYDKENSLYNVVFENQDGTNTLYMFDYPVKYISDNGDVRDIKLDIEQDTHKLGAYKSAEHGVQTSFPRLLSEGIKLSDEEISITLQPIISKNIIPANEDFLVAELINNKTVEYQYDDKTSLEYSLTYTGFKEDIVVNEYTGQTEYAFTLLTEGLVLEEIDGSYYLTDDEGIIKATIGDIIIFTADEKNNTFGSMTHETIRENQEYKLIIHVDAEYLRDDATTYPIRIDPTIEINYDNNGSGAIQDVTINSTAGSSGSSGSLFVGKRATYGISRTLMRFPNLDLSSIPSADNITSASVELRDIMCEAEALSVYCHIFTGASWNESTATWSNVSPNNYIATALSGNSVSYSNGINKTTKHRYSFNITTAVKGWKVGNYSQSKGLIFMANPSFESGSTNRAKTFASYNRSTNKPSLSITYTIPDTQLIADGNYVLNNLEHGKFIKTNLGVLSGSIGDYGITLRWDIKKISGGYAICPRGNSSNYLAVPTGTNGATESTVVLSTINNASIPPECIWTITDSGNGGYYIRNNYNSLYLYCNGTSLSTVSHTGAYGGSWQKSCVWRIENRLNSLEMDYDSTQFSPCDLVLGYSESILQFRKVFPPDALWTDISDFTYSGYDRDIISFQASTGTIIPRSIGDTEMTIVHKPTGYMYTMKIKVWNSPTYLGTLSTWKNCESSRIGYWTKPISIHCNDMLGTNTYLSSACDAAYTQWKNALGLSINRVSSAGAANIRIWGNTMEELQAIGANITPGQAGTTDPVYHNNPDYYLKGYYLYNNSAKFLFEIPTADVYIAYDANETLDDYISTCTHELGHALGFLGHSSTETDVMYLMDNGAKTLSQSEIDHLTQLYE